MLNFLNKRTITLKSFVIFWFLFLLLAKLILIWNSYSYAFSEMSKGETWFYFFKLIQEDLLILSLVSVFVLIIWYTKNRLIKSFFLILTIVTFWIYLADILTILFFQQRFMLTSGGSFITAGTNILLFYVLVFFLCCWFLVLFVRLFLRITWINIKNKWLIAVLITSFFIYTLPLPKFVFLWIDLPKDNILSLLVNQTLTISLTWKSEDTTEEKVKSNEIIDVPKEELDFLIKKKERWYGLAYDDPERIFESFKTSSLTRLTDEYWNSYVFEILAEAAKNKPELAFIYLDNYKDRKDENDKPIVKDLLKIAIQTKPELAFEYLKYYENFVEDHEKIAKSLLQYAAQIYQAPLTFDQLYYEVQGRKNKNNVILVFLESASSVDSQKFWWLNNRLPKIDKISNDWTSFINMHANGSTSEMWHTSTLLWVEPLESDSKKTRYESFTWFKTTLPNFFNELGYSSIFVSTAPLTFLDQRTFLEKIGYQTIIGEEAFELRPKYTFNAAPDADLYAKAIETIDQQTGSYFLTLQTISSHTPYDTPYGHSTEAVYQYEDDTFAQFYEDLKARNFFNNWILIVIWDHRKMTPLEDEEFKKWWATASAKIIGFMIWKNIPQNTLANGIYQQTDLYHSLIREFWSWEVTVLKQYNDLFSKEITRKRSLKQRYWNKTLNISDANWNEWSLDLTRMKIVDWAENFPTEEILNYVRLSLDYQKSSLNGDQDDEKNKRIILVAHRWLTKKETENSLKALKKAYDAWADWVEIDINVTRDWELVVYHGPKLYNNTQCKNETRDICQMTYDEVKNCLLNNGDEIMKAENLLPQIKNRFTYIFIDFKVQSSDSCPLNDKRLFEKTVSLVQKNKMDAKVIFSSFNEKIAKELGERGNLISALDTYSLWDLDKLPWSYYSYFMTPAENFTDALMQKLQRYLIDGVAYTVNDVETLKNLQKLWVKFVMTDDFEKLKNAL